MEADEATAAGAVHTAWVARPHTPCCPQHYCVLRGGMEKCATHTITGRPSMARLDWRSVYGIENIRIRLRKISVSYSPFRPTGGVPDAVCTEGIRTDARRSKMHSACEPSAALPFHSCKRARVLVTRICRMHRTSAEQPGRPPSDCT